VTAASGLRHCDLW